MKQGFSPKVYFFDVIPLRCHPIASKGLRAKLIASIDPTATPDPAQRNFELSPPPH